MLFQFWVLSPQKRIFPKPLRGLKACSEPCYRFRFFDSSRPSFCFHHFPFWSDLGSWSIFVTHAHALSKPLHSKHLFACWGAAPALFHIDGCLLRPKRINRLTVRPRQSCSLECKCVSRFPPRLAWSRLTLMHAFSSQVLIPSPGELG